MQDDFDLDGLSPEDARAYVTRFVTSLKQVQRDRAAAEDALALWKKRTQLAVERGESDLARQSLTRAEEAHANVVRLKAEENELDFKVTELKRRLQKVEQQPESTVNTEILLGQLESIVGTDHETQDALADAEAEAALEALKQRMEEENGRQP